MKVIRNRRSLDVLQSMKDVYTTTEEVIRMGIRRACWSCGHEFALGDPVSIAITEQGNKALCSSCFEMADAVERVAR